MSLRRCFVCAADTIAPTGRHLVFGDGRRRDFSRACRSCGVLIADEADPAEARAHLERALGGTVFESDAHAPYGLDLYTLRSAATRFRLAIQPLDGAGRAALRQPHSPCAARAGLIPLADGPIRPVSLGLICRPADEEAVRASLPAHAAWTDDVVLLLDGEEAAPRVVEVPGFPRGGVRVAARPLAGDFAGQRNALQGLARHGWMMQLDADETLAPGTAGLLSALAALAEAGEVVSVGLPRENRVDGVLSDVYPDVQYRLNRAGVAYAGRVHERPVLDGGWPRSLIALHGAIVHHLSRAHVLARSRRYEALDPGRGRPEEESALLQPFAE
jgi:hypothetical protein